MPRQRSAAAARGERAGRVFSRRASELCASRAGILDDGELAKCAEWSRRGCARVLAFMREVVKRQHSAAPGRAPLVSDRDDAANDAANTAADARDDAANDDANDADDEPNRSSGSMEDANE